MQHSDKNKWKEHMEVDEMNCIKIAKANEPSGIAIELFKAGGDKCLKS